MAKMFKTDIVPMRVGFVLIDGFALMSYAAAVEPLRAANLLSKTGAVFDIQHVALKGAFATSSSGAMIPADHNLQTGGKFDILFVVAGGAPIGFRHPMLFKWLRRLDRHGVTIGGVSGGAAILAEAGLLENRRFTLHWDHIPALGERHPNLLIERSLFVMDRDRITCAGGMAPLDMMHMLIANLHGQSLARAVSDWFLHTEIRAAAGPQRAGLVERFGTTNPIVIAAIESMTTHLADTLSLAQLAQMSQTSPRNLTRAFGKTLGQSVMQTYRKLRLEKAQQLLTGSSLSLQEISIATGFASVSHFSSDFSKAMGQSPSQFRSHSGSSHPVPSAIL